MPKDETLAREIARSFHQQGDFTGWFETLYQRSDGDDGKIPWADLAVNALLTEWLDANDEHGRERKALVVGCGLGDDAEELSRRGFDVTAFDVSDTAVAWCKKRFPESVVDYCQADVLALPSSWQGRSDFVWEAYTIQSLPLDLRNKIMDSIASVIKPGGGLLLVCQGCDEGDERPRIPWPLTRRELAYFQKLGFVEKSFKESMASGDALSRRFLAHYVRINP